MKNGEKKKTQAVGLFFLRQACHKLIKICAVPGPLKYNCDYDRPHHPI